MKQLFIIQLIMVLTCSSQLQAEPPQITQEEQAKIRQNLIRNTLLSMTVQVAMENLLGDQLYNWLKNPIPQSLPALLSKPESVGASISGENCKNLVLSIAPAIAIRYGKKQIDSLIQEQYPVPQYPTTWWHFGATSITSMLLHKNLHSFIQRKSLQPAAIFTATSFACYYIPQQIDTLLKTEVTRSPFEQKLALIKTLAPVFCYQFLHRAKNRIAPRV